MVRLIDKYFVLFQVNNDLKGIYKEFKNDQLHDIKGKSKLEIEIMFSYYLQKNYSKTADKRRFRYYYNILIDNKTMFFSLSNITSRLISTFFLTLLFFMFTINFETLIFAANKIYDGSIIPDASPDEMISSVKNITKLLSNQYIQSMKYIFVGALLTVLASEVLLLLKSHISFNKNNYLRILKLYFDEI